MVVQCDVCLLVGPGSWSGFHQGGVTGTKNLKNYFKKIGKIIAGSRFELLIYGL